MVKCPNKNLPEWKELVRVLGENEAYYIWDQNNGYGLDKAPNGAESKLFSDLLQHYNGDRDLAIRAKANVYSKAFKNWFGDWNSNFDLIFDFDKVDNSLVDVEEHNKPWKNNANKINKTVRIYLKGQHEKGYFELVKDEEPKYYSIHLKTSTERTGSLTTSRGEKSIPSTREERKILWDQLINLIPDGSIVSTWGELSDDGIYALNKIGRLGKFNKIGERQVSKKKSNEKVNIPVWQKESKVSKVVDENGEPLLVYHGGAQNITEFKHSTEDSTTTGYGFYTDEKTGNKIPVDSNRTMFFSSNKHVGTSYGLTYAITQLDQLKYKVYSLIETVNEGAISTNVFKSLDGFYDTLDKLSEYNIRFSRLKEYIIQLKERGGKLNSREREAFREILIDARKTIEQYTERWLLNLSQWDNVLSKAQKVLTEYSTDKKIQKLIDGEIPEVLMQEWKLYEKISKQREKQGLDKIANYDEVHLTLSNTDRYYLTYDGKNLQTWTPDYSDKLVKDLTIEELKKFIEDARRSNEIALSKNKENEKYKYLQTKFQMYPVFLNIKNPLVHDYEGTHQGQGYKQSQKHSFGYVSARQVDKAIKEGNDGVVYENLYDPYLADNYGVFNPNQIKSIDNRGTYSIEDNNIYNQIESQDELTTDVDPVYIKDSMFAFEEQSGTQTLTAMKASDLFFESQEMRAIADRFTNIDGINVVLTNDNTYVMQYDANTRTIRVSSDAFYTQDPNYLGRAFLHELVHDYTIYEYQNNPKFAKKINRLFDKVSTKFPVDKYGRKGLYYGLSKPEEFISEIYTNAAFRELVLKNSASIWQKFLSIILDGLGLNNLANSVMDSKVNSVINSITRIIDKRNTDPTLNDLGDGIFNMDTSVIDELNKEAKKISENILRGMKARNRSLRSRGYSPVKLEQMEQELNQMQELFDKEELKKLTFDFIQQASVSFKPSLVFIREAYLDPSKITNERLLQFKEDFLEFYGPIVNSISTELFLQDFFNDLSPENRNMLQQNIEMIEMAYKEMKGKYDKLVKVKTVEFIRDYFVENGLEVDEAEKYINDILNSTNTDITQLATIIRSNKTVGDLGMRTMYKIMTEINDDVQKFANEKAQHTLRTFEKLSKSEIRMFYELDKDGKATGYLIRDLNYGQFKKDMHTFLSELDTKYGVVDGNISALDDDKLKEYQLEKEEWLATHCERKFKPAYYKAYLELKPKTREKLESLNGEISSIIATVTDDKGIHLEKLSNEQWKSLDALYNLRRNLANKYHSNGVLKTGEELEIAEDLKKFYDVTGNSNIRSVTFSNDEVIDIMNKKKAELSPEDYAKWERRSISRRYSDSFLQELENLARKDYGEDAAKYQELVDKRNELRSLGRDNSNPYTDANKLHPDVKKKIMDIDEQIYALSKRHKGGTKPDDLPFTFEKTPQYEADKARMKALGNKEYLEWHRNNHLSNGKPASYYTRLVPRDPSGIELRLNMANRELDKDSPLVNKNYDFDSPEYYQPKRSLYDNSEAYAKALATQEQQDAYNLVLDIMTEANNKITFMKKRDAYKLPQITGDIIDFAFRHNSLFKGIKDYFGDGMVANADDVEYALDSYTQKPDGTKLNFIDTHYIQMLKKPEYISRNLAAIVVEYARMAENYMQKQARQADFELFAAQLANRDFEDVSILTKSRSRKKGINTNKYKMYYNFLEMNLYGQFRSPLSFTIGNKQYSLTKIIDGIRNYASTANLSNNFGALGKALFQGIHKSVVEAIGGRYYSADDYFYALGRNLLKMPKMLWNLGNVKHNDLTLSLMEYNGISRDSRQKTSNYQYIRPIRVALNYLIWGGWSFVDYIVKAPVVEAIYKDYKLDPTTQTFMSKRKFIRTYHGDNWKEGSKAFNMLDTPTLLDAYEVKNGVPVLKDEYKDKVTAAVTSGITAVATHMTNRIDGILSQEDKTKIMAHALGGALFMHRSFYIVNLDEAIFTDHQYNPYVDDYVEAKYKSGFRAIFKWLANVAKVIPLISYRGKSINSVEAYNAKKIISQLSLVAVYAILSAVWLRPAADDDKDNWLKQFINYVVSAVVFDERSEYNPLDVVNKIKSPSAVFGPIETIISLGDLINPFRFDEVYSDDVIQKGHYEDMYIWQKNLLKSIPGVRGVIESRDMRTKQQYLDSQIKK